MKLTDTIFPEVCRLYLSNDVDFNWLKTRYQGRISNESLNFLLYTQRYKTIVISFIEKFLPGLHPLYDPSTFLCDCLRYISGALPMEKLILKYQDIDELFQKLFDHLITLKDGFDKAFSRMEKRMDGTI